MHCSLRHRFVPNILFTLSLLMTMVTGLVVAMPALAATSTPASFADLAEQLGPAVVNIYTTQTVKAGSPLEEFFSDQNRNIPEPFRHFFDIPGHQGQKPPREMKRTSLGSGVIITADGYIVTNNHMVENATEINIRLTNQKEYVATIIGRDPKTDLALLKITPTATLPPVVFGDSDKLRVGDWVLAIGNPFGFEQTVTAGIVSGKGRHLGGTPYENFIQTDASINPGNSGGPLFDVNGKMVGINTAIYSRGGGNIGIGFAIPISMAKNVIDQLKEHGKVERGWLGVMIQQVTQELADQFGLERPMGGLVGEVSPGSPADKAGIKAGDIIVTFQGMEISQMNALPSMVAQTTIGTKAEVGLIRQGKKKTVTVVIAKLEEEQTATGDTPGSSTEKDMGLTVQELTPELAQSMNIKGAAGLIIANVDPDSAAATAGLRQGDLLLEMNRVKVVNLNDFQAILKKTKNEKQMLLLIKRGDHTSFVVVKRQE
ncbi:MAG: peptidase S1 [Desulfobacterales bacterium CG2_30_60_27]|nr:MAG: peptidase S1 [Desulfobacterales bacterium CG2_30_60_27]